MIPALFNAVLQSICCIFGICLRYIAISSDLTNRQKRTLGIGYIVLLVVNTALLFALLMAGVQSVSMHKYSGMIFAGATTLLTIAVMRGRIKENLFVFGIVLNSENIVMTVPAIAVPLMMELNSKQGFMVCMLMFLVLQMAIYPLMRRLLKVTVEPFLRMDYGNYWKTIWMIPLAILIASNLMVPGDVMINTSFQVLGRMMLGMAMLLHCRSIAESHRRMAENQQMMEQLSMSKVHYAGLQTRFENARKNDHDMKHLLSALRRYMDTDDKTALAAMYTDIYSRHTADTEVPYTGNAAADGVLYHYILAAREKAVHLSYVGRIKTGQIADMDLCVLLGNALENAMQGCMTCKGERSIAVISHSEEHLLSIVVRNSFDGYVKQEKDALLSRKEAHAGVGMSSMKSVCERYGGTMEVKWDEQTFTVMFLLPV